jgi:hypothetical protein
VINCITLARTVVTGFATAAAALAAAGTTAAGAVVVCTADGVVTAAAVVAGEADDPPAVTAAVSAVGLEVDVDATVLADSVDAAAVVLLVAVEDVFACVPDEVVVLADVPVFDVRVLDVPEPDPELGVVVDSELVEEVAVVAAPPDALEVPELGVAADVD